MLNELQISNKLKRTLFVEQPDILVWGSQL